VWVWVQFFKFPNLEILVLTKKIQIPKALIVLKTSFGSKYSTQSQGPNMGGYEMLQQIKIDNCIGSSTY
jgi:hypothetical protein